MHKREPNPIGSSCSPVPLSFNKKFSKGKFFVFDRKRTLITDDNQLISPEELIPLLETFDQVSMLWSIIDTSQLAEIATAYLKKIYPLKKDPIYVQYSDKDLENYFESVDNVKNDTHPNDDKRQIKFGQTTVYLEANVFNSLETKTGLLILFSILIALDEARLKIHITPAWQAYGISSITTAPGYCEIDAENIVLISPDETCNVLSQLGLIILIASDNYLKTLVSEHLSNDQRNLYLHNLQTDATMRPLIADIKKEISRICCICDEQPKAEKIAAFNRLIARIYEDKNQYPNPYLLINHWEKDENPIRIDGFSVQDDLRILKENKRPRLGSFLEPLGIQTSSLELFKRYMLNHQDEK